MIYELDEEFVMQMEDSIIFKWLSSYSERFISCMEKSQMCTSSIVAEGNSYTYALLFMENYFRKSGKDCNDNQKVFITTSGENQNILKAIKEYSGQGIVISQGGNAKRIAREKNWYFFSLPKGIPSRFLLPEVLGCLTSINGISVRLENTDTIIEGLMPSNPTEANLAKKIAYGISRDFIISVDKELRGVRRRIEDMMMQNVEFIPRLIWNDQLELFSQNLDERGIIRVYENKLSISDPLEKLTDKWDNLDLISVINILDFASVYFAILKKHDVYLLDKYRE